MSCRPVRSPPPVSSRVEEELEEGPASAPARRLSPSGGGGGGPWGAVDCVFWAFWAAAAQRRVLWAATAAARGRRGEWEHSGSARTLGAGEAGSRAGAAFPDLAGRAHGARDVKHYSRSIRLSARGHPGGECALLPSTGS